MKLFVCIQITMLAVPRTAREKHQNLQLAVAKVMILDCLKVIYKINEQLANFSNLNCKCKLFRNALNWQLPWA